MDEAEIREIAGFPGYRIFEDGRVQSCRPRNGHGPLLDEWRELKSCLDSTGRYLIVGLSQGSSVKTRYVHQIVAEAFLGPRPEGCVCRHLNDIKKDNRRENLAWGTPADNLADAIRNRVHSFGSRQGRAKLSEADIPVIRKMIAEGSKPTAIAGLFGVSHAAIYFVAQGKTWSHVPTG